MVGYKTDLEIAREANKKPIIDLAKEKLSISDQDLIPYKSLQLFLKVFCQIFYEALLEVSFPFLSPSLPPISQYLTYFFCILFKSNS